MEIIKRLIMSGSNEVNAVLISDEGEEYPIFLESLHNTIMFPALIESGYKLAGLPYDFVKDGRAMSDLPVEKYTCDDVTLEMMYNSIGVKLPYEEIKAKIDVSVVKGLPLPPTNYTIFTRDELLKYLEATELTDDVEDFRPLNYFVAPEARFSIKEYRSSSNLHYVRLITRRREMSLQKFDKLLAWLQQFGLNPNPSVMDVLDAYFAWGMDGLDFTIVNKRRESRAMKLRANTKVPTPAVRRTVGFVDGLGNLLTPLNERDVVWKLPSSDPDYVRNITQGLQPNETIVMEFKSSATQEVTVLEGIDYNIQYSQDTVLMQLQTYTSIQVKSPVEVGEFVDTQLVLPSNRERLYEHCTIVALARMLYIMRKPKVKVSSYDALKVAGCNPKAIFNYITTKFGMDKDSAGLQTGDEAPVIFDFHIDKYLEGEQLADDQMDFLNDIVNGVFNIDNIASGKKIEDTVSTESVYCELYALHNVMGISLEEIYKKFAEIKPEDKAIVFTDGELIHKVDVSQMKFSLNGYKLDVNSYDAQASKVCNFFTYVTAIAREVGDEKCRRHVGAEFFMVNKTKAAVKEILLKIERLYEEKVHSTIANVAEQTDAMKLIHVFSLSRFFEIVMKGTITYPKFLGQSVERVSEEMRADCRKHVERKIENITAYCSLTVNTSSAQALSFSAYCVNAFITPEYVIPRGNTTIPEVPFYALWTDWASVNPGIYAQLVATGVLPSGFTSWEARYSAEQLVQRDLLDMDSDDSLLTYYNKATDYVNNFPNDEVFESAPHPCEYMFPGLYMKDEDDGMNGVRKLLPTPREGAPVIRIGLKRDITIADYKDKLFPVAKVKESDVYIKPYTGFSAESFILVNDVLSKLPTRNSDLTVMAKTGSVYVMETGEVMDFTRILSLDKNKYDIVHVCNRTYLFKSVDGKLWEVRI